MYGALDLIPGAIKKKKEEQREGGKKRRKGLWKGERERERDLEDLRTYIVPQITLEFLPD